MKCLMKCLACGDDLEYEVAEDLENAGLCDACNCHCDHSTWGGYADDFYIVCGECLTVLQAEGKALA